MNFIAIAMRLPWAASGMDDASSRYHSRKHLWCVAQLRCANLNGLLKRQAQALLVTIGRRRFGNNSRQSGQTVPSQLRALQCSRP